MVDSRGNDHEDTFDDFMMRCKRLTIIVGVMKVLKPMLFIRPYKPNLIWFYSGKYLFF